MSINASSSFSSISTSNSSLAYPCFDSSIAHIVSTTFTIVKTFFLLPLSLLILYLGLKRMRQQDTSATNNKSDLFTYHMAAMELISIMGCISYCSGAYTHHPVLMIVGWYAFTITFPGQVFLHVLTCMERYLAVVHPITYVGFRKGDGVRIRSISVGCVWLLTLGSAGLLALFSLSNITTVFFGILAFSLILISFCSLSVLRVLKRPGPGEGGGSRERVDPSKQRAFQTLVVIMSVLLLWFAGFLVCLALHVSVSLSYFDRCVVLMSGPWFSLPSSFAVPLLYLHRAGKLPRLHYSAKQEQDL